MVPKGATIFLAELPKDRKTRYVKVVASCILGGVRGPLTDEMFEGTFHMHKCSEAASQSSMRPHRFLWELISVRCFSGLENEAEFAVPWKVSSTGWVIFTKKDKIRCLASQPSAPPSQPTSEAETTCEATAIHNFHADAEDKRTRTNEDDEATAIQKIPHRCRGGV